MGESGEYRDAGVGMTYFDLNPLCEVWQPCCLHVNRAAKQSV